MGVGLVSDMVAADRHACFLKVCLIHVVLFCDLHNTQTQGKAALQLRRVNSKSAEHLMPVISTALDLVFGEGSSIVDDDDSMRVASSATLSRSTYKIDLLHMILRRKQWQTAFDAKQQLSITLSAWTAWTIRFHSVMS